ncbi:GNAT family N-acetyltransferase [Bacillus methanolicus]|uniref:GNAT family N-acetyltransferase n=1 Tax=Bacillus methanolicus TaxID=1471 RepID=UPI00315836F3
MYKEGLNENYEQVGFARVISDLATFAYLCDVFVLPKYRGLGLSKWLVKVITSHPELKGVRRFMLATLDAHSLYAIFGFEQLDTPERFMQINRSNIAIPTETTN